METSREGPQGAAGTLAESDTLPAGPRTPQPAGVASGVSETLSPGQRIGERYTLIRRLGVGGMGEVWEVRHLVIDKAAAVKFFSGSQTDEAGLQRFWREARATAALRHPGIVDVQDFGTTDDGMPYIVMELLEGRPLSALLAAEGTLPWPRARAMLLQLTSALSYAHKRGVIHRDLKPSNIFLAHDHEAHEVGERCKIIDFGIAKLMRHDPNDDSTLRTNTGMLLGTPVYMSPEQIGDRPLDARSDIYSLGCVAYEMLTGRRPFDSPSPTGLILQHLFEPPVPPSKRAPEEEIPEDIEAIVLRALCKHPENRFQSMAEMRAAIEEVGFGHAPVHVPHEDFGATRSPSGTDITGDRGPEEPISRARWLALAGAVSIVVALAFWLALPPPPVPQVIPAGDLSEAVDAQAHAPPQPIHVPDREPVAAATPAGSTTAPEPAAATTGAAAEEPHPPVRETGKPKRPGKPPKRPGASTGAPSWEEQKGLRSPFERDAP